MPSNENLTAIFTDISNAIRSKDGSAAKIKPVDMADKITNIPAGGGQKYNFRDLSQSQNFNNSTIDDLTAILNDPCQVDTVGSSVSNLFNGAKCSKMPNELVLAPNKTNASGIFFNCKNLTKLPMMNTINISDMSSAFSRCSKVTEIPAYDLTNVKNLDYAFSNDELLISIKCIHINANIDVSPCIRLVQPALSELIGNLDKQTETKTLTVNATQKSLLTTKDDLVASSRGWTIITK